MQIPISSNAEQVLRHVHGFPPRMAEGIARALDKENLATVSHIQATYLSGPRPAKLGVRTNALRGRLRPSRAVIEGNTVSSAIGTNLKYAGVHEHGFDGPVTVRAHSRNVFRSHQTAAGSVFDPKTGKVKKTRARKVSLLQGATTVRSFTRNMRMPARPFLAPGVADRQLDYGRAVSHAIEKAWTGGSLS